MFGIWKVGAVFSPINFNYKGRLLSYQINDTEPKMLITEQSLLPFLDAVKMDMASLKVIIRKPKRDEHDYNSDFCRAELDNKFESVDFDET